MRYLAIAITLNFGQPAVTSSPHDMTLPQCVAELARVREAFNPSTLIGLGCVTPEALATVKANIGIKP